jgi:hypothetical protein
MQQSTIIDDDREIEYIDHYILIDINLPSLILPTDQSMFYNLIGESDMPPETEYPPAPLRKLSPNTVAVGV